MDHRLAIVSLAIVAGCGGRTDLATGAPDAGARESGARSDGGVPDPCAPIFTDCDGTVEDCGRAFERGCRCGPAPALRVGPHGATLHHRWGQLIWTGQHLAVSLWFYEGSDPQPRLVLQVLDASGARVIAQRDLLGGGFPGSFLGPGDGPLRYSWASGPSPASTRDLVVANVDTGEVTTRRVEFPAGSILPLITPIGGGDLMLVWKSEEDDSSTMGLLEAGRSSPSRTAGPFPYPHGLSLGWDGRRFLVLHWGSRSIVARTYDPRTEALTGPFTVSDSDTARVTVVPSAIGWLVLDHPAFSRDIELFPLAPDGRPAGPARTWPLLEREDRISDFRVAAHAGEILLVASPSVGSRLGQVGSYDGDMPIYALSLAPDGTVLGPPRMLVPHRWEGEVLGGPSGWSTELHFGLVWAGYSFAIAYSGMAEDGWSDTWVQRICP